MFAEIGLLVLEGDAAGLAAKVSELSAVAPRGQPRRRSGVRRRRRMRRSSSPTGTRRLSRS